MLSAGAYTAYTHAYILLLVNPFLRLRSLKCCNRHWLSDEGRLRICLSQHYNPEHFLNLNVFVCFKKLYLDQKSTKDQR